MKKNNLNKLIFTLLFFISSFAINNIYAQEDTSKTDKGYVFTIKKQVRTTPVKNQYHSGTCWCFAGVSFIETELIRMGKEEYDLSEMFIVWHTYSEKATKYVRMHGNMTFAAGGESHDVIDVIRDYGIVPEQVYTGLNIGEKKHIHSEMDLVLKGIVDAVIKNKNKKITPVWHNAFDASLNAYLGETPKTFTYKEKEYTPKSFAKQLGLNPDDYIEITSFTHHPFYKKFIIEIPDNWSQGNVYNIPLDELEQVMDNAINNGYSLVWASDVSEEGASFENGIAVVPEKDTINMSDSAKTKWDQLTDKEKDKELYSFKEPGKEKIITQEIRQQGFDNYTTGDDHGMHIIGIASDQNGTKYYKVKNSWGTKIRGNDYKGYFYASESFVRYKTISIIVNKNAIPKNIRKKLGI